MAITKAVNITITIKQTDMAVHSRDIAVEQTSEYLAPPTGAFQH